MPEAWRIVKEKHASSAFSGEGAAKAGGRWNSRGVLVVYASATRALAALESLVHLNPPVLFKYRAFRIQFPESMVERVSPETLPHDWRDSPPAPVIQKIGDTWVREGRSAVLELPSAIIPGESNYLLNPFHPDFYDVVIGRSELFAFDPRLLS